MNNKSGGYVDKFFNVRPLLFFAIFIVLTILVCSLSKSIGFWIIAAWFALLSLAFMNKRRYKDKILDFVLNSGWFKNICFGLCVLVCASFFATNFAFSSQKDFTAEGKGELIGVIEKHTPTTASAYMLLSSATFNGEKIDGKITVWLYGYENFTAETLDKVSVSVRLKKADAEAYYINNNIKYYANVSANAVKTLGEDKSLRSVILRYSKGVLDNFLGEKESALIYSMIFGDSSDLDQNVREDWNIVGLAHALAVSGMNVALLAMFFMFILRLFGVRFKWQCALTALIAIFYCYLCGFAYSILRATIMFLSFLVAKLILERNDHLSNLSFAVCVILCVMPYSIASVSFQLSVVCVFGIAVFMMPIEKFLERGVRNSGVVVKKLADFIIGPTAIYVAAMTALFPLLLYYFGYVSVVGLFANIILLPLISIAFVLSVLTILVWVSGFALWLFNPIITLILNASAAFAELPFAWLEIAPPAVSMIFYYLAILSISSIIFIKRRTRYIALSVFALTYLAFLVII
ncbi:MAG: ComEC/Rec2 family competence protein [Christensenellaceae bacterium]|jgi:ComEC/Rec2-related protein|nr:ComEC/Rec2 family competence protein [Christensenellaceae bacterium]